MKLIDVLSLLSVPTVVVGFIYGFGQLTSFDDYETWRSKLARGLLLLTGTIMGVAGFVGLGVLFVNGIVLIVRG